MRKFGIYLINAFLSALIGAFIEILSIILEHKDSVNLGELFGSTGKGVLIGTIALYIFMNLIMRFRSKPAFGFIASFFTIAVLMALLFLYDVIIMPLDEIDYFRWSMAFITAETLGLILTAFWYRWVNLYKDKLEKKKASIID